MTILSNQNGFLVGEIVRFLVFLFIACKTLAGVYQVDDERMFMMKWRGSKPNAFVAEAEAKIKYPQEVIAFYESKIVWIS